MSGKEIAGLIGALIGGFAAQGEDMDTVRAALRYLSEDDTTWKLFKMIQFKEDTNVQ